MWGIAYSMESMGEGRPGAMRHPASVCSASTCVVEGLLRFTTRDGEASAHGVAHFVSTARAGVRLLVAGPERCSLPASRSLRSSNSESTSDAPRLLRAKHAARMHACARGVNTCGPHLIQGSCKGGCCMQTSGN
eukprot:364597-Chlamydomonas_euryale.AAC.12